MKIVKIKSGLGNQMFQYAFAKTLQEKTGEKILLDTSNYDIEHLHNGFELNRLFEIDLDFATRKQVEKIATIPNSFIKKVEKKFFTKKTHLIENEQNLDLSVFEKKGDLYFEGYWQNEKYFEPIKSKINSIFDFKLNLNEKTENALKKINQKTASVHIRRGDYLLSMNKDLNICTNKFYQDALNFLQEKTQIEQFFVFSDDVEWCKNNFDFGEKNTFFVDWNKETDSWQDMFLMSKCKFNIIPNSSFSFWAAYLNQNKDKIVIAPKIWKKNAPEKELPKNWVGVSL